jgi:hypothetical protein
MEIMSVFDRHLESAILRQRGQNRELVKEIREKLSEESKERLFRIFQDMDAENSRLERKARMPWQR